MSIEEVAVCSHEKKTLSISQIQSNVFLWFFVNSARVQTDFICTGGNFLSLASPRNTGDEMIHEVQWPRVPVRRERVVVLHNCVQGAPARGEK